MKDTDYVNIHSVNSLYFIINKADGYSEENNGSKYLIFASTDKSKLRNYTELWNKIKSLIEKINDKQDEYNEKYMKVKFDSDDNLPLDKVLSLPKVTIVVRSVFQEDNKYYPQDFVEESLYEL